MSWKVEPKRRAGGEQPGGRNHNTEIQLEAKEVDISFASMVKAIKMAILPKT